MSRVTTFIKNNIWLVLIIALAIGLRLFHLTAISLWHDEAFSALLIKYPWGEMIRRIGLDVHPPMYYIFLRLWHYLLGDSLWSLRGFSAFFGVLTIPATYLLVKQVFKNHRAALIAALLIAISPFQLQYVTEARMYTMGAFFAITAALFLSKALEGQKLWYERQALNTPNMPADIKLKKRFLWHYLFYVVSTIIIIYTHYYLLFTAAAICFYGLVFHWVKYKDNFKRYSWLIVSYVAIGAAFLPWLKTFLFQFHQVGGSYWIPSMNRWSIPDTVWRMTLGLYTSNIPNHYLLVAIAILILFVLYRFVRKAQMHEKWLIVLNIIAPFAGSLLFALIAKLNQQTSSVYLDRYFLFSSTFLLIALALFIETVRPRRLSRALLTILVAINLFGFVHYWTSADISHHTGMAGATRLLKANVEPQQKIYVGVSAEFFNYKYYSQRMNMSVKPLLYTNGKTEVDQLPHYFGTAILDNSDLAPSLSTGNINGDTVWMLWTNAFDGGNGPVVPTNWTKIDEHGFADVRPYSGTWIIVTEYKVN